MNATTLAALINLAEAHKAADEYVAGRYEFNRGACAIGCTIYDAKKLGLLPPETNAGDHAALARMNGVPEIAWRLEDYIFEGLLQKERVAWPVRFLKSIRPDADYSTLETRIMVRVTRRLADDHKNTTSAAVCEEVASLWLRRSNGDDPTPQEWSDLQTRAAEAARAARAAWAARAVRAARAAEAAWASEAARAAEAAWAAWAAEAAEAAEAARAGYWTWLADVVCEELARA